MIVSSLMAINFSVDIRPVATSTMLALMINNSTVWVEGFLQEIKIIKQHPIQNIFLILYSININRETAVSHELATVFNS